MKAQELDLLGCRVENCFKAERKRERERECVKLRRKEKERNFGKLNFSQAI